MRGRGLVVGVPSHFGKGGCWILSIWETLFGGLTGKLGAGAKTLTLHFSAFVGSSNL